MNKLFATLGALKPLGFIKNVFSDDGTPSYGRFGAGVVLFSTVAWITYLVVKNHAMPDMAGPSTFLTTGVGVHYGAAKAQGIVDALKGNTKPAADADANKGA